jgi:hypothetical protein
MVGGGHEQNFTGICCRFYLLLLEDSLFLQFIIVRIYPPKEGDVTVAATYYVA